MTYSTEILTHFQCPACEGWYTVADHHIVQQKLKSHYCVHCGNQQSNACVARDQIAVLQNVIATLQQQVQIESGSYPASP